MRGLIQGVASGGFEKGSDAQKVGDYYASFMDENGIEAKKLAPLSDETTNVGLITVALTPAGRVVLPRARQLLAAGEKTFTAVAEAAVSAQSVVILSEASPTWRGR